MAGNRNNSRESSARVLRASAAAVAVCAGTAASLGQPIATFTGGCGTNQWLGTCQQGGFPASNWSTSPNIPYSIHHAVVPASAGPTIMCGSKLLFSFDCQAPLTVCASSMLLAYQDSHVENLDLGIGATISVLAGPGQLFLDGTSTIEGSLGAYAVTNTGYCTLVGTPNFGGQLHNTGSMMIDVTSIGGYGWVNEGVLTNSGVLALYEGHVHQQIINQGSMGKTTPSGMIISGLATFESGSFSLIEGSMLFDGGTKWKGGTATLNPGTTLLLVPPPPTTPHTHEWDGIESFDGDGAFHVATSAAKPLLIRQNVTLNDASYGESSFGALPQTTGLVRIGDATLTNNRSLAIGSTTIERLPGTTQGRIVNDSGRIDLPDFGTGVTFGVDVDTNWEFEQNNDLTLDSNATLTVGGGFYYLRQGNITGSAGTRLVLEHQFVRPFDSDPSTSVITVPFDVKGGSMELQASQAPVVLRGGGKWAGATVTVEDGFLNFEDGTYVLQNGLNRIHSKDRCIANDPGVVFDVAGPAILELSGGAGFGPLGFTGFWLYQGTIDGPGLTRVTGSLVLDSAKIGAGGEGNLENGGHITVVGLPVTVSGGILNRVDGVVEHESAGVTVQSGGITNLGTWTTTDTHAASTVQGSFDNQGRVLAMKGTLTFTGPIPQIVNGELTGGDWFEGIEGTLVLPTMLTKIGPGAIIAGSTAGVLQSVTEVAGGTLSLSGNSQFGAGLKIELGGMVQIPPATTATVGQPNPPAAGLVIEGSSGAGVLSSLKGGLCICDGPSESFVVTPLLSNAGAVVPGGDDEPGILDLTGAYEQNAPGELWIELGGTTPGMQHDVFEVSGQAALAGKLKVALIDGYVPASGAEFIILTAGSVVGTFNTLDLPALPAGLAWEVLYNPGNEPWVVLRVSGECYPDCNQSGTLTVADFGCFQSAFAGGDPYADCSGNGSLTIADFGCFQAKFAAGCP